MSQSLTEANLPLRVLVVDDEELARLRLKSLVGECDEPSAVVVGEAANAAQALVWLATRSCDLLLLDVQMPGRDGTQLAAELRLRSPAPAIVFVTAHAEHALKAFDLEAVDYLTKPVKRERLQAALRRVAQRLGAPPTVGTVAKPEEEGPVIVVSDRGRIIRVPVGDVLYMKAELKYVTLRTAEHTHVLDESLAELESRLGDRFLRVHRNALGRAPRRSRPRAARHRRRERRRRPGRLGRLHRAGQRVARRLAAPGRGGARGAGRRRALGADRRAARGARCDATQRRRIATIAAWPGDVSRRTMSAS
jgi:two-component system response regulator AlgR